MTYTPTTHQQPRTGENVTAWLLWVLLLIVMVALGVYAGSTEPSHRVTPPPQGCASLDADALTDAEARALLWAGWYGMPDDGAERLYSPSCKEWSS
jgi:hypothetical protein